jgi:hypothetical protein
MDRLEPLQIEALQQLQSVLGPHDTEFVIGVLESVAWDVQVSVIIILTRFPVERTNSESHRPVVRQRGCSLKPCSCSVAVGLFKSDHSSVTVRDG